MDIMMPEMDGVTAMRKIWENPSQATLPIIAMTAKSMPGNEQQCRDAGARDYISKPLDNARLIAMLRSQAERALEAIRLIEVSAGRAAQLVADFKAIALEDFRENPSHFLLPVWGRAVRGSVCCGYITC